MVVVRALDAATTAPLTVGSRPPNDYRPGTRACGGNGRSMGGPGGPSLGNPRLWRQRHVDGWSRRAAGEVGATGGGNGTSAGGAGISACGACGGGGASGGPPAPAGPAGPAGPAEGPAEPSTSIGRRRLERERRRYAGNRRRGCGRTVPVGNGTGIPGIGRSFAGGRGPGRRPADGAPTLPSAGAASAPLDGMETGTDGERRGRIARHVDTDSIQEIGDGVLHRLGERTGRREPSGRDDGNRQRGCDEHRTAKSSCAPTRRRVRRSEWDHLGALGFVTEPRGEVTARFRRGEPAVRVPQLPDEGMDRRERSSSAKVADGSKTRSESVFIVACLRDGDRSAATPDVAEP